MQSGSYPSGLSSYFSFRSSHPLQMEAMKTVSCIHSAEFNVNHLHLTRVVPTANSISIEGTVETNDTIIVAQNIYPGWKYHSTSGSGKPSTAFGTFMAFPVKKGPVDVQLTYWPQGIVYCLVASIFAWFFCGIILFKKKRINVYRNS
jgi:uncharacterized membrane protein YfhO